MFRVGDKVIPRKEFLVVKYKHNLNYETYTVSWSGHNYISLNGDMSKNYDIYRFRTAKETQWITEIEEIINEVGLE